jgi:hypothetical protein
VPLSEELVELASSDIFCLDYPEHPFSQTVTGIASEILGDRAMVLTPGAKAS